eukprot:m.242325 g.242325  ORF g.242325 m.242325 type:complete len:170 (+) comp16092_c0_seq1:770-1279(+)
MTTGIADIPIELLIMILTTLNLEDEDVLVKLCQVCKVWTNALCLISTNDTRRLSFTRVFKNLCKRGKLHALQHLCKVWQLEDEIAKDGFHGDDITQATKCDYNYAFRLSCFHGHLSVAQWLTSTFNLTAEDTRADNNDALSCSCYHKYRSVAQWYKYLKSYCTGCKDCR